MQMISEFSSIMCRSSRGVFNCEFMRREVALACSSSACKFPHKSCVFELLQRQALIQANSCG